MPSSPPSNRRVARRPLKSPLAVAGDNVRSAAGPGATAPYVAGLALTDRATTLADFEDYLRTRNNRDGRPYEEKTISAYLAPGKNLDGWLTANGIHVDFTAVSTALLNRYFREYYLEHGQGGTHTLQRNLIQLFNFLAREREHPTPYTDALNRYAEVKGRPKTLGAEFVDDLLEVTGSGRARDFETARDHAIIRILRSEGVRRAELLGMVMHTLPADLIKNPMFRLVPLKGARAAGEGRLVVLAPASARALAVYLRARRHHRLADSDWVWLGTRGRGGLRNTGLRMILVRRAEQAGYTGVTPHQFRHTFSDDFQVRRLRGRPDAAQRLEVQGDGRPVRRRRGQPAGTGGQAAARRHVLSCTPIFLPHSYVRIIRATMVLWTGSGPSTLPNTFCETWTPGISNGRSASSPRPMSSVPSLAAL